MHSLVGKLQNSSSTDESVFEATLKPFRVITIDADGVESAMNGVTAASTTTTTSPLSSSSSSSSLALSSHHFRVDASRAMCGASKVRRVIDELDRMSRDETVRAAGAIFVIVDEQRVDALRAIITGPVCY